MEKYTKEYQESDFEGKGFVEDCLKTFDEGVAKIEAEYAITSKSA